MYGRGVSRGGVLPLLLGLGLLAGLFLMHGVTATPTPIHVSAPVLTAHTDHAHHSHGVPAAPEPLESAEQDEPSAGHSGVHAPGCGVGAMCFALLVGLVLALARGHAFKALLARVIPARSARSPWSRPRPRPPSVYQLSVLRL